MGLLESGQVIRDTYEVERFLGEGAFAEVYRVRHRFLGRQAMKVFKRTDMNLAQINDLLGEAILLSQLEHPNIVRVYDANILRSASGTHGYFTMEHLPGGSLEKFWQSYDAELIPLETTLDVVKQVCRGIDQAHSKDPPIVHRDIKPQNILVGYETEGLRARVSDFGLAKSVNPLTLLATSAGTIAFKAPETFADPKGDSCTGDVWGIGCTLYLLITDHLPIPCADSAAGTETPDFKSEISPPSRYHPDVDAALDKIVLKSLAKNPRERYQTAHALLTDLNTWCPRNDSPEAHHKRLPGEPSKSVLGLPLQHDSARAKSLVSDAFAANKEGRLGEAADLMEEAFNLSPDLRSKHERQVKLWRCGISM